ncbi:TcdA/TcdB catalytic glycosyltransferase domain-containing protein [Serratia ureilytica]|uniref:TcdA/TcdB catalytic glycosyltransferase domain-containing protein n=1 Tax=Serratia ureilytica TaxID=300181 RepID=UPI001C11C56C|nr:TcdA/TcdB catalytic glycosyltransferase domain-containing protein [Serratia ureilytica]MBU5412398.1 glycosyl transferase [Serratia ureilytica]
MMKPDYECEGFKEAINVLKAKGFKKTKIPDKIHFVWIGDLYYSDMSYIKVWGDFNKDKHLFLWSDPSSSDINDFQQALKLFCDVLPGENDILRVRNEAFNYIWPKIKEGETFNDAACQFLNEINHGYGELRGGGKDISDDINVMDIQELFVNEFVIYKKFYYYELVLRGNFACASDFVRLLILYKYGGIYIDIDTLPYIDNVYQKTNNLLNKHDIRHDESVYLAKTHAFLCVFNYINEDVMGLNKYLKRVGGIDAAEVGEICEAMISDLDSGNRSQIAALGDVFVYDNLISISTVKFIHGVFFNNIIASAPGSRLLKNLLKRVEFNFRYIESNKGIFGGDPKVSYSKDKHTAFSFLLNYRHDVISKDEFVTLYLSGPMLISNTIYRVICGLTGLHRILSIENLARLMQSEALGIGFQKQTLDTPLGISSAWRNNNE